jgi:hypothetical protein
MSKNKNLAYAVGIFLALVYVGWAFFGRGTTAAADPYAVSSPTPIAEGGYPEEVVSSGSPTPAVAPEAAPVSPERQSYALSEADVTGLPPDAQPGTRLELWVAWDPPITKVPKLQRLLKDVVLERVIPGIVPEAPSTILLSVRAESVPDLLWADRYGNLSVIIAEQ